MSAEFKKSSVARQKWFLACGGVSLLDLLQWYILAECHVGVPKTKLDIPRIRATIQTHETKTFA